MSIKSSSGPQSFLDQVIEICDRILNQPADPESDVHHERPFPPPGPVDGSGK
jgi:hypothetical protein